MFDYCGIVEDGAIVRRYFGIVGHEEVSSGAASGLWFAQIAGVAMRSENHVAAVVCEHCILLRGEIVEQLFGLCDSVSFVGLAACYAMALIGMSTVLSTP